MRVGILELLTDSRCQTWTERLYGHYFRKQFVSIMPQVVSVWCRQLGHTPYYATYYGQRDPLTLLPNDLDIVFISTYTQASALAYALAKVFRAKNVLTVIGGPHARSFPQDSLRFFDFVITSCNKTLIADLLNGRFAPPALISGDAAPAELPSVEERMPEIAVSSFSNGRPTITSLVPLLSSIGCPYSCNFCLDWNSRYVALPTARLQADLAYIAKHYPNVLVGYHDPNFAVRFEETMDAIESTPGSARNRYIMESSLSVLKPNRLRRLKETGCIYIAPGIESWESYGNKAGVGEKSGRDKLEQVVEHFRAIHDQVPGTQANIIFGTDDDRGNEPVELTKEFIRRAPFVFPSVNIPTPFGGTPLFERYLTEGRVLRTMPFALYYNPYLVITPKNYDPPTYYRHVVDIFRAITSNSAVWHRLGDRAPKTLRFVHFLRGLAVKRELAEIEKIERLLRRDKSFRSFHEGRSRELPTYYRNILRRRLGAYANLLGESDLLPVLS